LPLSLFPTFFTSTSFPVCDSQNYVFSQGILLSRLFIREIEQEKSDILPAKQLIDIQIGVFFMSILSFSTQLNKTNR